jgi:hypothetical protein
MSGARSGVNGTPTFVMNGVRHDDFFDLETLLNAIEAARGPVTDRRESGVAYTHLGKSKEGNLPNCLVDC